MDEYDHFFKENFDDDYNFIKQAYDYNLMEDSASSYNDDVFKENAVAKLCYHCGITVKSDYYWEVEQKPKTGVKDATNRISTALKNHFDYSRADTINISNNSPSDFNKKLKESIDMNNPFIFIGTEKDKIKGKIKGHAFVGCGYSWTYGGYDNVYFKLNFGQGDIAGEYTVENNSTPKGYWNVAGIFLENFTHDDGYYQPKSAIINILPSFKQTFNGNFGIFKLRTAQKSNDVILVDWVDADVGQAAINKIHVLEYVVHRSVRDENSWEEIATTNSSTSQYTDYSLNMSIDYDYKIELKYKFNPLGADDDDESSVILGSIFSNIISSYIDTDGDDMSDEWEEEIIEHSKGSNSHIIVPFKSIDEVKPNDDYDKDDRSNLVEFQEGTNPCFDLITDPEKPLILTSPLIVDRHFFLHQQYGPMTAVRLSSGKVEYEVNKSYLERNNIVGWDLTDVKVGFECQVDEDKMYLDHKYKIMNTSSRKWKLYHEDDYNFSNEIDWDKYSFYKREKDSGFLNYSTENINSWIEYYYHISQTGTEYKNFRVFFEKRKLRTLLIDNNRLSGKKKNNPKQGKGIIDDYKYLAFFLKMNNTFDYDSDLNLQPKIVIETTFKNPSNCNDVHRFCTTYTQEHNDLVDAMPEDWDPYEDPWNDPIFHKGYPWYYHEAQYSNFGNPIIKTKHTNIPEDSYHEFIFNVSIYNKDSAGFPVGFKIYKAENYDFVDILEDGKPVDELSAKMNANVKIKVKKNETVEDRTFVLIIEYLNTSKSIQITQAAHPATVEINPKSITFPIYGNSIEMSIVNTISDEILPWNTKSESEIQWWKMDDKGTTNGIINFTADANYWGVEREGITKLGVNYLNAENRIGINQAALPTPNGLQPEVTVLGGKNHIFNYDWNDFRYSIKTHVSTNSDKYDYYAIGDFDNDGTDEYAVATKNKVLFFKLGQSTPYKSIDISNYCSHDNLKITNLKKGHFNNDNTLDLLLLIDNESEETSDNFKPYMIAINATNGNKLFDKTLDNGYSKNIAIGNFDGVGSDEIALLRYGILEILKKNSVGNQYHTLVKNNIRIYDTYSMLSEFPYENPLFVGGDFVTGNSSDELVIFMNREYQSGKHEDEGIIPKFLILSEDNTIERINLDYQITSGQTDPLMCDAISINHSISEKYNLVGLYSGNFDKSNSTEEIAYKSPENNLYFFDFSKNGDKVICNLLRDGVPFSESFNIKHIEAANFDDPVAITITNDKNKYPLSGNEKYRAKELISTEKSQTISVEVNGNIEFNSGKEIILNSGFEVKHGAQFEAIITTPSTKSKDKTATKKIIIEEGKK